MNSQQLYFLFIDTISILFLLFNCLTRGIVSKGKIHLINIKSSKIFK
jgi:hypothetical protein